MKSVCRGAVVTVCAGVSRTDVRALRGHLPCLLTSPPSVTAAASTARPHTRNARLIELPPRLPLPRPSAAAGAPPPSPARGSIINNFSARYYAPIARPEIPLGLARRRRREGAAAGGDTARRGTGSVYVTFRRTEYTGVSRNYERTQACI